MIFRNGKRRYVYRVPSHLGVAVGDWVVVPSNWVSTEGSIARVAEMGYHSLIVQGQLARVSNLIRVISPNEYRFYGIPS